MNDSLTKNARRIQDAIEKRGFDFIVRELPQSTRTAADAAKAIGCEVGQIAKSLIFKDLDTENPLLAVVSGANQVDTDKLAAVGAGHPATADAKFARASSGFSIGGIPPFGHRQTIRTFIDEDLLRFDRIWAAAGTPNAVFEMDPSALLPLTLGVICELKRD
ncbi:MAG: prolyl-tRNA editing protein [marine bacterium B5-7]|nr:MAG: prolyl-tRNA editing protein [marine bacterium B5-7]